MDDVLDTIFLRLEGPLQAWGDNSKFVIRRTMETPTKSGVLGLICCAIGWSRQEACGHLLELNTLAMGVRIDRPGNRWWDYHTVGAKIGLLSADGKGIKRTGGPTGPIETLLSRREYLCDASFLVVLQGNSELIRRVADSLQDPKWPVFLGRKSCPPSVPILVTRQRSDGKLEAETDRFKSVREALESRPWRPRHDSDAPRNEKCERVESIQLDCQLEWRPSEQESTAPPEAEVWYDVPVSFDPPVHEARFVVRNTVTVRVGGPTQQHTPPPLRPRANYSSSKWQKHIRPARLEKDKGLCVFCKQPASQVHHASYRNAGGDESVEHDLRSLCGLCHDAVTMIEYGMGLGMDRVDPSDPGWRDEILAKRDEIRRWRSEEGRRRAPRDASERIRRELLEEED